MAKNPSGFIFLDGERISILVAVDMCKKILSKREDIYRRLFADALPLSSVELLFFQAMLLNHNERASMMSVKHETLF